MFVANFLVFTLKHAMVAAPMRTRYDQFGKQMVRTALETRGPVETDTEVPADTRRIDLWFIPDPARGSVPEQLGLLGRIAGGPSTLEFFHNTPSGEDLAGCLIKHGEFRHNTELSIIPSGGKEPAFCRRKRERRSAMPLGIIRGPSRSPRAGRRDGSGEVAHFSARFERGPSP